MKHIAIATALGFALMSGLTHSADMKGMDMKGMDMKAGDMKDMPTKDMGHKGITKMHTAKGTVKSVDTKAGTVTIDHEPVKSMKWPAMSMAFQVKDKALLDKLAKGKKVEVEFEQRGKEYVIMNAK